MSAATGAIRSADATLRRHVLTAESGGSASACLPSVRHYSLEQRRIHERSGLAYDGTGPVKALVPSPP